MTEDVKPGRRRYDGSLRQEQARRTREAILDAAQRCFEGRGYAATTVAAIAGEAGVSPRTVHLAFDTKAGIVRALWNHRLRRGREEVPVAEQPWYQAMMAAPDADEQVRLNAVNSRLFKERAGGLLEVLRSAAAVDGDVGALWERINAEFRANQRTLAVSLDEKGALRPGMDVERAADILWTLNHPDVWALLVGRRGWSPDAYERWLYDAFRAQLLV